MAKSHKSSVKEELLVNPPKGKVFRPALATAGLLWFCYFPANCGWLSWIALVPLLSLVRSTAKPRRIYTAAWIAGMAFSFFALQWMRVADYRMYATWIALTFYCSLYWPVAIFLIRRLERSTSLPLVITLPVVWTALEFARSFVLGGFSWYYLGHAQHEFLALIQITDLGGAYAVTFVVAAVNALVFEGLLRIPRFQSVLLDTASIAPLPRRTFLTHAIAVLLLIGLTLAYGAWRLSQTEFEIGPRVALVQGNLDQRIRNQASSDDNPVRAMSTIQRHYDRLSDEAAIDNPELIVWPETSYGYPWFEVERDVPGADVAQEWQTAHVQTVRSAASRVKQWETNLLLGVNATRLSRDKKERRYNSAVLIDRDGKVVDHYDKIHCVPFGEYVPLRNVFPWMSRFAPYDFDYSITPGERQTRFRLGNYTFGVLICYEDSDPFMARRLVTQENSQAPVDFVVNISNDGWFDGTSEHEEHLAICRFRAIECRRTVTRAVNMGISAIIDGNGKVIHLPAESWSKSKKIEQVVSAKIPIDRRTSFYARFGDWLPWLCWSTIALGLVWGRIRPAPSSTTWLA